MVVHDHATATLDDFVDVARGLAPALRERAAECEELRRIPDATVEDFRRSGLFRIFQPARYGGYELDYGLSQVRLGAELGRACGSSAWTLLVTACHSWIVGMFAESVQDAVWHENPETLIASSFAFNSGKARKVDGGYVLSGDWSFSSGSQLCDWVILGAPIEGQPLAGPAQLWCLVPRREWEIVDVWFAEGLRGSASNDIRIRGEAFVPDDFTLDTTLLDGRPTPGSAINPFYIYRLPVFSFFPFNVSPESIGIARGAIDAFVDQATRRAQRSSQPPLQMRLAESMAEVDAAEALLLADATEMARVGRAGEAWDPKLRARVARDLTYSTLLCCRAVNRLAQSVGGHSMQAASPLQRAFRDVYGVANHGANNWDMRSVAFGRSVLDAASAPTRRP
jgi:3-hydroxy-9,10-secoandrosta-1,3,5(10)-triene-9,17-dione monooxygenase